MQTRFIPQDITLAIAENLDVIARKEGQVEKLEETLKALGSNL